MNGSSRYACIDGFAEELDEIIYQGLNNWLVSFRSLFTVYSAHFSYFVVFFSIIGCGLLSHRHSVENGKKYTQFWLGALIHGVISERGLTANRYWHAQAPVMFFGKQLPLHIVFLYPSIIYVAMMIVQRLKLNVCTEPAAVGLIVMLMEIPYRMISVKFLHITYHDSDPIYYHKLCGVPWVEVFSALVFSSSYVALYHGVKYYQSGDLSTIWDKSDPTKKETLTTIFCGIFSPIVGFLQKILLFHLLHDLFNVNPVSCLFFVFSLYFSFVICFEPKSLQKNPVEDGNGKNFLFYQVLIYLSCILCLALFGKPQNEISIGSHEPVGDCTMLIRSRTPLGRETEIRKYLCTSDLYKRSNFLYNFDCVPSGAPLNVMWYTICGTSFRNRVNFLVLIFSCCLMIFAICIRTLFDKLLIFLLRKCLHRRKRGSNHRQQLLKRKKFLCADEVAARKWFVYNFDCLEEGPPSVHAIWYTICGSPIYNRPQFFLNVLSFILLICTCFSKTLLYDGSQLEAGKRLILRFRSRYRERPNEEVPEHPTEEVTVGYVLVDNNIQTFSRNNSRSFKEKGS